MFSRTDRNYAQRFKKGVAKGKGVRHTLFNHRIRGAGLTASYYIGSDATLRVVNAWNVFNKETHTLSETKAYVKTLRESWLIFMVNPTDYVNFLLEVGSRSRPTRCMYTFT
jgi:hypothetical protein